MPARLTTAAAVAAPMVLTAFLVRRTCVLLDVSGPSMLPTYRDGDRLLAVRAPKRFIRRGAVVSIRLRTGPVPHDVEGTIEGRPVATCMIKRVVALPGDDVSPHLRSTDPTHTVFGPIARVVPLGHVFVLGDHREVSHDSRHTGPLPLDQITGVVLCRIRPPRGEPADETAQDRS
ncbi:S26 family signal peptidase [Streptomyces sp. LX-29]|uniref:peptidase S26 family protein n=1 Tax=Streptomyces sp. LX-29 TaxID=2900152 RepID=UPI00240E2942|nr:S26 family signal peptidase [Streptomyces sp. LX-29]WFB05769.1 S26 family signal peptidase [Streptomyces sp. LX-29]